MRGTYYKTLYQNKTFTDFLLRPDAVNEQEYGEAYIHCRAKTAEYQTGTPLYLEGRYHDGIFFADKVSLPYKRKDDAWRLLRFLMPDLDKKIAEQVLLVTGKDIPAFMVRKDALSKLRSGLAHFLEGEYVARKLCKKMEEFSKEKELYELLVQYDIPIDVAARLKQGKVTVDKLKEDPYQIIYGVPIYKAEEIARDYTKITPFDERRLRGYLSNTMERAQQNGNTCLSIADVAQQVNACRKRSPIFHEIPIPASVLYLSIKKNDFFLSLHEVSGKTWLYQKKIWDEENNLVFHAKRIQTSRHDLMDEVREEEIEELTGFHFNEGQKNALQLLKTSGIKVVTGPPGSGKTALILGVIQGFLLKFPRGKIQLAATTGAASQVMKRSCGHTAKTVHKLLDIRPIGDTITSRESNDPIPADLLIVDEVSMMDLQVASCLFKAVRSGTLVVLVGDVDQLSSVGYGSVLRDLIKSEIVEVYYLTEVMRQSGLICENARKVNLGQTDLLTDDSFEIREFRDPLSAMMSMMKSVQIENSMVLSPVRKDILGTENINDLLQDNNTLFCFSYGDRNFFVNDRIIMTKTNYTKGYFNGDIGTIESFEDGYLKVRFTEKELFLTKDDFEYIELAYCITIHKSQGSEADVIHVLLPEKPENMLVRNMIYTAITRAKKKVIIYSVNGALWHGIKNRGRLRLTQLSIRLKS